MKRFENKVIVVTGASRGIGQTICSAFAREGARVIGVARGSLTETAGLCGSGEGFIPIQADLGATTQSAAASLVSEILGKTGRIDALINNAGIIRRAPAVDFSEADWNAVIATNLSAPFFLCQAVTKWWLSQGREKSGADARLKIINIASLLSFQGGILVPAYTASKHGIAGVTKALANEWAKERVNVNAIAPGYIATENTRALREDPKRNQAILDRIPENRWGKTEDIAGGCLFLASPDSDYLNGAIINIDGGWLGR
ncbi:MAG TPA: SDR family NAD(P)-dependent oxidoreductase [Verrucomicrobiae bacterium]|jgi:2-deoxy-D-gluconate 3-dehydrogenase|nr:SDR family NAD(P)-dependent oxidoreductase [Verrucomicrobiae bacterium]